MSLRGWTLWDDERIKRMGWDKVDVLGWIAQGDVAYFTGSGRLESMREGRCFIERVRCTPLPLS